MSISLFDGIKEVAYESTGAEFAITGATSKYEGKMLADCFEMIDEYEAIETSFESTEEFISMQAMSNVTLEMEDLGLESVEQVLHTNLRLGNESIVNKIKRGGYKAVGAAKDVINKIINVIKAIIKFFAAPEGRLKSYGKLFKKYREKLQPLSFADDKEGTFMTNWNAYIGVLASFAEAVNLEGLQSFTTRSANASNSNELDTLCRDILSNFFIGNRRWFNAEIPGGQTEVDGRMVQLPGIIQRFQDLSNSLAGRAGVTADASGETLFQRITEYRKDGFKDDTKEYLDTLKEAFEEDTIKYDRAKGRLCELASRLEAGLNRDLKYRKGFDKLIAKLENIASKKGNKRNELDTQEYKEDAATRRGGTVANFQFSESSLRFCTETAVFLSDYQLYLGRLYKFLTSKLQGALKDMAKCIAGAKIRG